MGNWIFQANPDSFELDNYLVSGREVRWTVGQKHLASTMRPGDSVYIWRAAGKRKRNGPAGVVASGTLLRGPQLEQEDPSELGRWVDAPSAPELRVRVQIERVAALSEVLQRDWLREDPILRDLHIFKYASMTNFSLDKEEADRLAQLWQNEHSPWLTRELVAVLWLHAASTGAPENLDLNARMEEFAVRTGRTVAAVRNKLAQFQALQGMPSQGMSGEPAQVEQLVHSRYENSTTGSLDLDRLQTDYATMWGTNPARTPRTQPEGSSSVVAADLPVGQGYESDPEVRRAVERRAMDVAMQHYLELGFRVEDTSANQPYDLCCILDGREVRVEVKGTRGEGEAITVTSGEVKNAQGTAWRTDLFIVSGIEVVKGEKVTASGGAVRWIQDWSPREDDLSPTQYRYQVPISELQPPS